MSKNTQYLRGKQRERGSNTQRFMTDGFDRWAETSAPASFNTMEKNPTELVNDDMASGVRYSQKLDGMVGSSRGRRKGKCGGAWYDDAWNSVQSGWNAVSNEFTNPNSYFLNEFNNPQSVLRGDYLPKLGNEFTDKDSLLRGQYLGQAADGVAKAAPIIDILGEQMGLGKGVGKTMAEVLQGAQQVNKAAASVGLGKHGKRKCCKGGQKGALDYVSEHVPESREGIKAAKTYAPLLKALLKGEAPQYSSQIDQGAKMLGLGKKKRGKKGGNWWDVFDPNKNGVAQAFGQPVQAQAVQMPYEMIAPMPYEMGRPIKQPSRRNEIVRDVMRERGVSLAEASSIVKREGLY